MRSAPRVTVLTLAASLLALSLPAVAVTPAGAATHERTSAPLGLRVSAAVGVAGSTLQVSGTGFSSGERVDLFVGVRPAGAVTADAGGAFTGTRITVPAATPPGPAPVTANGRYSRFTAQADFLIRSSWGQSGRDAGHTGVNAEENVLGPGNVASLSVRPVAGLDTGPGRLTVANGDIYLSYGDGSGLSAITVAGASAQWTHPDPDAVNGSTIATATRVFYRSGPEIQALDARTGKGLWRTSVASSGTGLRVTGFSYADGALYAVVADSYASSLYRLSAATGTVDWQKYGSYEPLAPAVADGVVYARSTGGTVNAVRTASGDPVWSTLVPATDTGVLAVSGDRVIAPFRYGLAVLERSTGAVRWTSSSGVTGDVAVAGNRVVCDCFDFTQGRERLSALDLRTGSRLWTSDLSAARPVIANGVVYAGSDHQVYAVDLATGGLLTTLDLPEQDPNSLPYLDAPVSVVDGAVLVPLQYIGQRFEGAAVDRFVLPDREGVPTVRPVDDSVVGADEGQFRYAGGWVAGSRPGAYQDTFHYARSRGATATVSFTGVGARVWYSTAPGFGTVTVSIDDAVVATLDQSSPIRRDAVKSWTSEALVRRFHTVVVTSVGTSVVDVDRVDVGAF